MRRRKGKNGVETAIANFGYTFAKVLLAFCMMLFVLIVTVEKTEEGVKPKVEAMIIVDWGKDAFVDVDTWVRNPAGGTVYFGNKEAGVVFLDRDDLGNKCISVCEEIVSIRGLIPGEYIVNLNVFASRDSIKVDQMESLVSPLTIHVKIVSMNPAVTIDWEGDVTVSYVKQEKHVVRFSIVGRELTNFTSDRPIQLIKRGNPQ